jgi:uncharacterized protein related to proFAR isomerase
VVALKKGKPIADTPAPEGPVLIPNLYLDGGKIVEAESGVFRPILDSSGKPIDPFEAADRLVGRYHRFCVVDLEGLRRNRAQLDYLQELSRSGEMWVDAGIRTGDQVIDILVTGARRAVLSTAYLLSQKELRRAWRLSTEVLLAIESDGHFIRSRGNEWDGIPITTALSSARSIGVVDVILRTRNTIIDWSMVRELAAQAAIWVDGGPESAQISMLKENMAVGGFVEPPRGILIDSEPVS